MFVYILKAVVSCSPLSHGVAGIQSLYSLLPIKPANQDKWLDSIVFLSVLNVHLYNDRELLEATRPMSENYAAGRR